MSNPARTITDTGGVSWLVMPDGSRVKLPASGVGDHTHPTLAKTGGIFGTALRSGNVTLTSGTFTVCTGWATETVPSAGTGWTTPTIGTNGITVTDQGLYLVKSALVICSVGSGGVAGNEYVVEPTLDGNPIIGQSGVKFYIPTANSPEMSGLWYVPITATGIISMRVRAIGTGTLNFGGGRLIVAGPVNRYAP